MRLSLGRKSAVVVDVISIYVLADDILIAIYHFTYQKKNSVKNFLTYKQRLRIRTGWLLVFVRFLFFSIKSTRNNNTNNVWERCGGGGRRGEEKEEVIYQIQFNLKLCRSIINFHNRCLIFSNFISNLAFVENQPQLTSRRPIHLNEAKWNESRSYHNNNYDDR